MARFSSIEHSPAATRGILRDRFARYLTSDRSGSPADRRDVTLSDESMLRLLLNLKIDFASDVDKARAIYDSALSGTSDEPTLEVLIDAGWLTVVWGRISATYDLVRAAEATIPALSALCSLLKSRFDETYSVSGKQSGAMDLDAVTTKIRNKEISPGQVGCKSRDWVAARLWDRTLADYDSPANALRVWFDRWAILGHPSVVPQMVWDEDALATFREAAFTVLESNRGVCGWEDARNDLIEKYALVNNEPTDTIAARVPPVPESLTDRVSWVFDVTGVNRMREHEDLAWLVSLLLSDVEHETDGLAPHPIAKRLIEIARESPDLFFILVFQASGKVALLADLLLHPATTAAACLSIAKWQQSSGAWDRELIDRDNRTTKSIAFADAVSVLGHFLAGGDTDPKEAASLMDWFYENSPYGGTEDIEIHESLLVTLRSELSQQPRAVLRAMVDALLTSAEADLETSKFGAAVDLVDCGDLSAEVDPMPFVDAYISLVGSTNPTHRSVRMSNTGAATLVRLALRLPRTSSRRFFYPIDIAATLEECSEEERYSLVFDLGWSIRTHVRTLCRAISGLSRLMPADTAEISIALVAALRTGALAHREKGRIAAFSPHYEEYGADGQFGRPIAADIGSAICKLLATDRDRILSAVLETDEPMLLAQLIEFAPHTTRDQIRRRVGELTPSDAGKVDSLTYVQLRIESLLAAGLADVAEQFIDVERELRTLGVVAGRAVTRLRTRLRLHLLREEWKEITNADVPEELTEAEERSAVEAISFYKALALLRAPDGDYESAQETFTKLHRSRPDVFAYFLNLFAVQISILIEDDPFKLLSTEEIISGRKLLAETEKRRHEFRTISKNDADIFTCNHALLLLALDQPQQAIDLLSLTNPTSLRGAASAYRAIALDRLDHRSEAKTSVEEAILQVGETELLRAVKDHLVYSKPYSGEVLVSSNDDSVERVKAAFFDFRQMNHVEQAKVLLPAGSGDELTIAYVRAAATSVIELVSSMQNIVVDSCEDDLNTLFRELLAQRFELIGWSVRDQSKGGYTAKGNPGERDLVLTLGATTIAIIEAVVCAGNRPSDRTNIVNHLCRLLAYGSCELFFLVAYSYVDTPSTVLQMFKGIARSDAPDSFLYRRCREIPHQDASPAGFVTHYEGEYGEVRVVFLVLDVHQRAQRLAAQESAS